MYSGKYNTLAQSELANIIAVGNKLALYTTMPAEDGTGGVEVTTNGYAQFAITSGIFPASSTATRTTRANPSQSGTYAQALTLVTVTKTAHGLKTGQRVQVTAVTGTPATPTGTFNEIIVLDANTFTYTTTNSQTASGNITFNDVVSVLGISNAQSISFPAAGIDLGTVKGVVFVKQSDNSLLMGSSNSVYKAYTQGDIITFPIGSLTVEINGLA